MSDTIQPDSVSAAIPQEQPTGYLNSSSAIDLAPLSGIFGLNNPSTEEKNQMLYIREFFDKSGVQSVEQMLMELHKIGQNLGMAALGEGKLQQTYRYIRTLAQIGELENLKHSMERNAWNVQ